MSIDKAMSADAALDGFMTYEKWLDEFEAEWNEPDRKLAEAAMEEQALQAWYVLSDDMREQLKRQDPKRFAEAKKLIQDIERKRGVKNG